MKRIFKITLLTLCSLLASVIVLAMVLFIIDAMVNVVPLEWALGSILVGFVAWLVYKINKTLD